LTVISRTSRPKVTVVIPTYNQAAFLRQAINSVCCQTCSSWEAVIINNYSDDDSEAVVASFSDARIRLENFRNHGIIAASRNQGIRLAQGDYIAFLDSDDIWYPEKLERCLNALESSGVEAVCHGERWTGSDGYRRDVRYGPESRATFKSLLFRGNRISTSATVVRRSALLDVGGFEEREDFVTAEDYDLWLRLVKRGMRFVFIPDILGEYRIHPGGSSQSVMRNVRATMAVFQSHFKQSASGRLLDGVMARRARALILYGGGRILQKQGQRLQALSLFGRAWLEFPLIGRLYLALGLNFLPDRWLKHS